MEISTSPVLASFSYSTSANNASQKAEEFEAMVLSQLLRPMFESAKAPGLFGGDGPEQNAFQSLLHEEYAKAIAARGGVGIADNVKDALIRLQSEPNLKEPQQ